MVLVKLYSAILFTFVCEINGHEFYTAKKDHSANFTKLDVRDAQNCIDACNRDRKCGAFSMVDQGNSVDCFIEDPSGDVRLNHASVMVKTCGRRCVEDCPPGFTSRVGGCFYLVMDKRLTWEAAESACQDLDCRAHLISINNQKVFFTNFYG